MDDADDADEQALTERLRAAERRWPATALVDRLAPALRRHQHELARDLAARQNGFTDEELRVVGRWIAGMADELHRRAGDLADERAGREEDARRRAGRAQRLR